MLSLNQTCCLWGLGKEVVQHSNHYTNGKQNTRIKHQYLSYIQKVMTLTQVSKVGIY